MKGNQNYVTQRNHPVEFTVEIQAVVLKSWQAGSDQKDYEAIQE
jgi:hypothetical protein